MNRRGDNHAWRFYLRGEATYIIEEYAHVMTPGDLMIVPPGIFHRAAFDDLTLPYERLLVYVGKETLLRMQYAGFSVAEEIGALTSAGLYCRQLSPEETEEWLRFYHAAVDPARRSSQDFVTLCQLGMLLTRLCDARWAEAAALPSTGVIGSVVRYINDHYREELTLEHLSQQFYMSATHLAHLFRRYARLSIHQYITAKRMMLARSLLTQGESPQEVSAHCGYQDYSNFYRAFVKSEGVTPRAYSAWIKAPSDQK